jgi:hypothetical protein
MANASGSSLRQACYKNSITKTQVEMLNVTAGTAAVSKALVLSSAGAIDFAGITPSTSTTGSLITPGSTWINNSAAGGTVVKLLCSSSATSGDFATMRPRARADAAGNVICVNASASAGANNHGNIYAVQGYAQPNAYTNNSAANIVCGLYSCIDAGGASSGRRWSTWIDTHVTTKASGGDYLLRMSHNGTIATDGAITIYGGGRLPVLLNVEDATPGFYTASAGTYSTADAYFTVTVAGTTYRMPLFAAVD